MQKILKKFIALLLSTLILLSAFAFSKDAYFSFINTFTIKTYAYSTGNDYPYKDYDPDSLSKWNFYYRQCTDFAAWCIVSRLGISSFHNTYGQPTSGSWDVTHWSNAKNWVSAANRAGLTVNQSPAVGAIACWTNGDYGHVAWVKQVNSNGTVNVEEYNYNNYLAYGTRDNITAPYYIHFNQQPKGSIDDLVGGAGTVFIGGWAFDPDEPSKNIEVHVYVGGPAGSSNAEGINAGKADYYRPDVNTNFGVGNYHGINATVKTSKRGSQPVYVYAIDSQGGDNPLIKSGTVTISNPDTTKPTASFSSTNNVADTQTVTLTMSDNIGLAGYYWGTNSSYSNNTYTAVSGTSKSVTKTISDKGIYYLTVKDTSGNLSSTVSIWYYKTILNANGGTVSPSYVILLGGNSFPLPTPVRSGCSFEGWNTESDGSGTSYAAGVAYIPPGNRTLYAQWKDTNKPTGAIASTNNVASSQTVTLNMSDNAGLAGYYWGTSSNYSDNPYTAVSGTSKSVTTTVSSQGVYYLTVKDTSGNIFTINKQFYRTTLNAKGGSVSPTTVHTMWGNSFALPAPTRTGYTFRNWNTKEDGSGTGYDAGASFKPTGNISLYAQWKANTYTVAFNKNGGNTGTLDNKDFTYDKSDNLPKNTYGNYSYYVDYEYNGATGNNSVSRDYARKNFLGWATTSTGAKVYDDGQSVNNLAASGTVTLYAVWDAGYTMPVLPIPAKTGYDFMGWDTKADGTGTRYNGGTQITLNENLKLYAQWQKTTYVIEYYYNEDSVGSKSAPLKHAIADKYQTKQYNQKITLINTVPKNGDYIFKEWNTEWNGYGTSFHPGDTYDLNCNTTLYAIWQMSYYCEKCGKEILLTVSGTTPEDAIDLHTRFDDLEEALNGVTYSLPEMPIIHMRETATVDYRSRVTITATAEKVPADIFCLAIYEGDTLLARGDNTSVSYNAGEMRNDRVFTVRVLRTGTDIIKDYKGQEVGATCEVKVRTGFFRKLVAFFKGLFRMLPYVEIKP